MEEFALFTVLGHTRQQVSKTRKIQATHTHTHQHHQQQQQQRKVDVSMYAAHNKPG